jgi:hypothetical protein
MKTTLIYAAIIIVILIIIYFAWKTTKTSTQTQPTSGGTQTQPTSGGTQAPSTYTPTPGGLPTAGYATAISPASDPELINILNYSAGDIAYLTVRQRINALNKLGVYTNQQAETAILQAAQAGVVDKKQVSGAWVVPGLLLQNSIVSFNNDPKIIAALANNTMYKPVLK